MAYEKYTKWIDGANIITLEEMKDDLKVDDPAHDNLIGGLITGWQKWAEDYCWSTFSETTWTLHRDIWDENMILRRNPIKTVDLITYYDENNTSQTLPSSAYIVYQEIPGRIELLDFPDLYYRPDAIQIDYKTEDPEAPNIAIPGIKSLVAMQYLQKEDFNPTGPYISMAKRIFAPIRLNYF